MAWNRCQPLEGEHKSRRFVDREGKTDGMNFKSAKGSQSTKDSHLGDDVRLVSGAGCQAAKIKYPDSPLQLVRTHWGSLGRDYYYYGCSMGAGTFCNKWGGKP